MTEPANVVRPPGTCVPWEEQAREYPEMTGDRELLQRIWEETDGLGYVFIWQCLLSF